jgi:ATP-dependent Clp protease ATP-binding subunit ClpC
VSKKSFRVYFTTHSDGRKSGVLTRSWSTWFDEPPPAAYGATEDDVYMQLELRLQELEALQGASALDRYLWEEPFHTRMVTVDIHPQTAVKKRIVIGKKKIPLRLTYAYCPMPSGFRVMLPRFDWWFICEDLDLAPEVLRSSLSSALLGQNPRWVYDFRHEGPEFVREWTPKILMRADDRKVVKKEEEQHLPNLEAVAEELTDKALRGKLPPIVGDDHEITRVLPGHRDPPPSLLLVGGPGVGKSTWVRRLARVMAQWRREEREKQKKDGTVVKRSRRIWATSADRLIAGMVYVGMWQERILKIIGEMAHEGDYLYVDRLTSFMRAQPDGSSIAELMMPSILAEEISIIAECTEAELERATRRLPAVANAFHVIRLAETDPAMMPHLLEQLAQKKGMGIKIHPAGLKRLVQHLGAYQRDVCFPGKGFRFLDWMAQDETAKKAHVMYAEDVSVAYSRYSGLPLELISDEHPAGPPQITAALSARVIGQDEACGVAARVLARFKAGMNDPDRPVGSLFFVGPTGVGKTELAKQVTRYMFGSEDRMIRYDMSEYMLHGSAQRLLEVGDGVASLAQKVRQQPLSLVLLDEIEKAHPEVFDLLLGLLGEGRLTDSMGRLVDFRSTVLVMTSNLGVSEAGAIGFGDAVTAGYIQRVRQHFRPEFFNRIDHVVSFRTLSRADVLRIVDLELDKAGARTGLRRRNLRLDVDRGARALLAELGFHPTRGARPLVRVIEEKVITPVAIRMAREPGWRDRTIRITEQGDTASLGGASDDLIVISR